MAGFVCKAVCGTRIGTHPHLYTTNWLGTRTVNKKIMYPTDNNCIDIIVRNPVSKIAFKISFEQCFAMEMKGDFW
jgi:hypothetical protein